MLAAVAKGVNETLLLVLVQPIFEDLVGVAVELGQLEGVAV